jgi:hypothetical protein
MKNRHLATAHFSAIGTVAGWWAYFEFVLDLWLWDFAGVTDEVGVCFTGQMLGARPRLDAFIALARHRGCKSRWDKIFDDFAKNATGLSEQRNRAVHDVWDVSDASHPQRHEATARRKVRLEKINFSTSDIVGLSQNIIALIQKFEDIAEKIRAEISPSLGTSEPNKAP